MTISFLWQKAAATCVRRESNDNDDDDILPRGNGENVYCYEILKSSYFTMMFVTFYYNMVKFKDFWVVVVVVVCRGKNKFLEFFNIAWECQRKKKSLELEKNCNIFLMHYIKVCHTQQYYSTAFISKHIISSFFPQKPLTLFELPNV